MSTASLDRRRFLSLLALGAFGVATGRVAARQLNRIGLQMRSVAEAIADDLPGTLERIASIGYREVEFWTPEGLSFDALDVRRVLERLSLAAPSRHVPMPDLFTNWRVVLTQCRALGNRHVVCDEIPEQERATLDGYARVADLLNAAGKITEWAGIQLALHTQEDDFRPREGIVPFDYLMSHTDPALVKFQMDLSVMIRVNRDPLEDFARYPGRFVSVHLHGVGSAPERRPVGLGEGQINFAAIISSAERAGVQNYFIEDDRPDSPWDHATANFAYLSHLDIKE